MLQAHWRVGSTFQLADGGSQPWPQSLSCCAAADHTKQNLPQHLWCLPGSSFGCATCETSGIALSCCLKPAAGVCWEGPGCRPIHMPPVIGPEQSVCSYRAIHSLWLPLPRPGVHRRTTLSTKNALTSPRSGGRSANVPSHPDIHLGLPPPNSACLLPVRLRQWKILWQHSSCMRQGLSPSPGRGEWCSPDGHRFRLGASAGSSCHLLGARTALWSNRVSGSRQGRPAELIRPKRTKIWPCERRAAQLWCVRVKWHRSSATQLRLCRRGGPPQPPLCPHPAQHRPGVGQVLMVCRNNG